MIAVVTGSGGMIGQQVMRALHADGHEARPLRHDVDGRTWRLGHRAEPATLEGATALIHLAWDLDPDAGGRCVAGSLRLFEECQESGIGRIVFVSSQSAGAARPTRYGAAKREVEDTLRRDERSLSVRPGLVWSDPPSGTFGRLMGTRFLGWRVAVSTPAVLHPVHVDDLAAILVRAAAASGPTGVLEVGAVQPVSAQQLVDTALGPGRQVRVPRSTMGALGAALSLGGSRGRILSDRVRGLIALEPMEDPMMEAFGVRCRDLTRLGQTHG